MDMQLRAGQGSVAWLTIGSTDVLFVGAIAMAFYGPGKAHRRAKIPARIVERYMRQEGVIDPAFEPLEDAVFECRLEEAIVDGLTGDAK